MKGVTQTLAHMTLLFTLATPSGLPQGAIDHKVWLANDARQHLVRDRIVAAKLSAKGAHSCCGLSRVQQASFVY